MIPQSNVPICYIFGINKFLESKEPDMLQNKGMMLPQGDLLLKFRYKLQYNPRTKNESYGKMATFIILLLDR